MVENTTVVAFLVDFVWNPHLFSEVWRNEGENTGIIYELPFRLHQQASKREVRSQQKKQWQPLHTQSVFQSGGPDRVTAAETLVNHNGPNCEKFRTDRFTRRRRRRGRTMV